jgi:hypothetical protein
MRLASCELPSSACQTDLFRDVAAKLESHPGWDTHGIKVEYGNAVWRSSRPVEFLLRTSAAVVTNKINRRDWRKSQKTDRIRSGASTTTDASLNGL